MKSIALVWHKPCRWEMWRLRVKSAEQRYDEVWRSHRRWFRAVWLLWLGWLPFGWFVVFPVMRRSHSDAPGFAVAFVYMAAFLFAGTRASSLRCPRCGERFFSRGRLAQPMGQYLHPLSSAKGRWSKWRPSH